MRLLLDLYFIMGLKRAGLHARYAFPLILDIQIKISCIIRCSLLDDFTIHKYKTTMSKNIDSGLLFV